MNEKDKVAGGRDQALVVEDKWVAAIQIAIDGEVQRLTQELAGRVQELEERYARPLAKLESDVFLFQRNVDVHLKKMGLAWT